MQIHPLTKENAAELTRMMLALWPDASLEEEYPYVLSIIQSDRETALLGADAQGSYVGFISVSLRTDYVEGTGTSPVGYVEGVYVREAYRGKGLGRLLLQAAETWCRQRGCLEMASDAELSNTDSQAFHEKLGFTEVNRIVCYQKKLE